MVRSNRNHAAVFAQLLVAACSLRVIAGNFAGWVDPDTKAQDKQRVSYTDGHVYDLVMSDEFNKAGRKFKDGEDPVWTGIDKSDDDQTSTGRKSLQFYNSSNVHTEDGKLVIVTDTEDTSWKGWNPYKKKYEKMSRHFKSGMVQSWNKFCYTGGMLEIDVQFPGRSDVGGLWPAVWLMGNLGRATYESSTNLMWPWSYEECNRDLQRAQEISGCDITSHFSLQSGKGRGATEIDIIEIMPGPSGKLPLVKNNVQRPYSSMTLQLAPGIPASKHRPSAGSLPEWGFYWYQNLTYGENTSVNPFFYGTYLAATKTEEPIARSEKESYQCDAISSMMSIDKGYFQKMHTFRLEWQPGDSGYLHWYVDGKFRFGVEAEGLAAVNANTKIPEEPSYVIVNTAISTSWGFPNPPWGCTEYDCKSQEGQCGMNAGFCKSLPAKFFVDHVRVYQNKNDSRHSVGCNPRAFPTKKFILAHEYRYKSLLDVHALKDTQVGGASCRKDAECGEGSCTFRRCSCRADWLGPNCLSPSYSNGFPDWDAEEWFSFSLPYMPSFLVFTGVFLASLLAIAAFVMRQNQYSKAGTSSSFSSPMSMDSDTNNDYKAVPIFADGKTPSWF